MGAIVAQHATALSDSDGDAVFTFQKPPQGINWCGTLSIPKAPPAAQGVVTVSGELLGSTVGSGFFGPFGADFSGQMAISVSGLEINTQYEAVWLVDTDAGHGTYPAAITGVTIITGPVSINIPDPLPVTGTVTVEGTVTANQGTAGTESWPVTP
jgi:hypothetical protein